MYKRAPFDHSPCILSSVSVYFFLVSAPFALWHELFQSISQWYGSERERKNKNARACTLAISYNTPCIRFLLLWSLFSLLLCFDTSLFRLYCILLFFFTMRCKIIFFILRLILIFLSCIQSFVMFEIFSISRFCNWSTFLDFCHLMNHF